MRQPNMSCLVLFMHLIPWARVLAFPNAGSSIAARMAMMAMTTSSSIKVKAKIPEGAPGKYVSLTSRIRVWSPPLGGSGLEMIPNRGTPGAEPLKP
jgi:hypothetical protein